MRLTLAVTTWERPDALAAVLGTIATQRETPDEVIVADDGSGPATRAVVTAFAARCGLPVGYVRQEHQGFRVARLRNLALAAARGDYVVLVDGDMLLHPAFIADHRASARAGCYVQGVRLPLGAAQSRALLDADPATLLAGAVALPGPFTRGPGLRRAWALHNPALARRCARLANALVAEKSCNQGFWRADLAAVNGYDETMTGWGPEDKELCARLRHLGRQRRTLVFGGIAWHLHHAPAARDRQAANEARLAATLRERHVRCAHGLDAHVRNNLDALPGIWL